MKQLSDPDNPGAAGSMPDNASPTQTPVPQSPDSSPQPPRQSLTLDAEQLDNLIDRAERRGYERAMAAASSSDTPGLYEEPSASRPPEPDGWKSSPLLQSRRQSIWDR